MALELSIDANSWGWSWSADIGYTEYASLQALNGAPLELEAYVNGNSFALLAEGAPTRSRSFGKTSVRLQGRGLAAYLTDPYAVVSTHRNASAMTAQQIAADALTLNGVPLGWTLDWQITDWLVPADAWSYQGTPLAAVLDVAASVGAIVQADPAAQILHVLPRYSSLPWEWSTAIADIQIPAAAIETDSVEPAARPGYNAIYVSGVNAGVLGQVVRNGTPGDLLAPMVTHALITDVDAVRQRGSAELGNTGRQARVRAALPISSDVALLGINQLAEIADGADVWRGLVRSVGISARRDDNSLKVRQSIELERHYL
jgi:hypothetical protein